MKKRISVVFRSVPSWLMKVFENEIAEYAKRGDYEKMRHCKARYTREFFAADYYLNRINLVANLENETSVSATHLLELLKKKVGKKQNVLEVCFVEFKKNKSVTMPLMLIP